MDNIALYRASMLNLLVANQGCYCIDVYLRKACNFGAVMVKIGILPFLVDISLASRVLSEKMRCKISSRAVFLKKSSYLS